MAQKENSWRFYDSHHFCEVRLPSTWLSSGHSGNVRHLMTSVVSMTFLWPEEGRKPPRSPQCCQNKSFASPSGLYDSRSVAKNTQRSRVYFRWKQMIIEWINHVVGNRYHAIIKESMRHKPDCKQPFEDGMFTKVPVPQSDSYDAGKQKTPFICCF